MTTTTLHCYNAERYSATGCTKVATHKCPDSDRVECLSCFSGVHSTLNPNDHLIRTTDTEEPAMMIAVPITTETVAVAAETPARLGDGWVVGQMLQNSVTSQYGIVGVITDQRVTVLLGGADEYSNSTVIYRADGATNWAPIVVPDGLAAMIKGFTERSIRVDALRQENLDKHWASVRELESFKEKVVSVATKYGHEHSMCGVLNEALSELGLEIIEKKRVTITVTVDVPWGQDVEIDDVMAAGDYDDYEVSDADDY